MAVASRGDLSADEALRKCRATTSRLFGLEADSKAAPVLTIDSDGYRQVVHHFARVPLVGLKQKHGGVAAAALSGSIVENSLCPRELDVFLIGTRC